MSINNSFKNIFPKIKEMQLLANKHHKQKSDITGWQSAQTTLHYCMCTLSTSSYIQSPKNLFDFWKKNFCIDLYVYTYTGIMFLLQAQWGKWLTITGRPELVQYHTLCTSWSHLGLWWVYWYMHAWYGFMDCFVLFIVSKLDVNISTVLHWLG